MKLEGFEILDLKQTCESCPSQWEGQLTDTRAIYIRFRNRNLTIQVSEVGGTVDSAIESNPVFQVKTEADRGRAISLSKVKKLSGLDWPAQRKN